jgi:hypothetical protein
MPGKVTIPPSVSSGLLDREQLQSRQALESFEILIDSEKKPVSADCDGSDQGVDAGDRDTLTAKKIHQARRFEVIVFNGEDPREALERPAESRELYVIANSGENFLIRNSGDDEGKPVLDQSSVLSHDFGLRRTLGRTPKNVRENGGVENDHRFSRAPL